MYIDREAKGEKRKKAKPRVFLVASVAVLTAALILCAVFLILNQTASAVRIFDFGTVMQGVSVNGIDISGMTMSEAMDATADIEVSLLGSVAIKLDVNGQTVEYKASDFSICTDYQAVMEQAMNYGHTGDFDRRREETEKAGLEGVDFTVRLTADREALSAELVIIKTQLDKEPLEAAVVFIPWGYTQDGTEYKPELNNMLDMAEKYARSKTYEMPERVRIPDADMPLHIRYQYYHSTKFENDYTPEDANVSRFQYTEEQTGIITDTAAVLDELSAQVENGSFSVITVPVQVTEPTIKLDEIKTNTALITSWTSSYASHSSYERNYNVAMMSILINGAVIMPGEEWSVEARVGQRTAATAKKYGWKLAGGLAEGGVTDQYGGGVCQLGSTTYNAAIRTGLKITDFHHHTVPSDYIPKGLDATLNSGTKDLKLLNENEKYPYYIVSYLNPKEKNVTVEIYGPPLIDPEHPEWDNVIYDYEFEHLGNFGKVDEVNYYFQTIAPNGEVLSRERPDYVFAEGKRGEKVRVYRQIYSLAGEKLGDRTEYDYEEYPVRNKIIYHYWGEDGPPPSPSPTDGTSADPGTSAPA